MPIIKPESAQIYKQRRVSLIDYIHANFQKDGFVVLFGSFEQDSAPFRQDPSFYYFTGIQEPACALIIDTKTGEDCLYVPNYNGERAKWVAQALEPSEKKSKELGFTKLDYTGQACSGYQCHPFFSKEEYQAVIAKIERMVKDGSTVFTLNPDLSYGYVEQRFMLGRIIEMLPALSANVEDISGLVAQLRRKKSKWEIEQIFKAIQITGEAHEAVARVLEPGKFEYEIQAAAEYIFTSSGASVAFPTIVGSGKNGTVLHYGENDQEIEKDSLVVVDMGAQYNMYCADITRTFPSSKVFTKRQKEIYGIVLEAQDYIANLAKPGMWLSNAQKPEESLNHLAKEFIQQKGYGDYFPHGIGHYLGLDVHDVGSYKEPLQEGDVITIEPGIYLPDENLGVRIEDNYWIVPDGVMCLSEDIPKGIDEIEAMVQREIEEPEEDE